MTQKQEKIMQNAFATMPSYVKKAIGQLKVTGPAAEAVAIACNTNRIAYQSPGLIGDSAIHFVFPKLKAGLLLKSKDNTNTVNKHKVMKCKKAGWNVVIVIAEDLEVMSQDVVTAHLKEFIKSQGTPKEIK